jgi:hypothetical protein
MNYYRYLFMALLVFSANAYALQSKTEVFEQFDDLRMAAFISMNDIMNSPEWNPSLGTPPLTVDEAINAVREFVNDSVPIDVREIELRPIPNNKKHWHYLIKVTNDKMKSKYDIYVVLMDGKIIPATIEPQGYK